MFGGNGHHKVNVIIPAIHSINVNAQFSRLCTR
jgi:hypothetical protein